MRSGDVPNTLSGAGTQPDIIRNLRQEIMRMEGFKVGQTANTICFDVPEIDNSFVGYGLPMGATHEFCASGHANIAASISFIAALLSKNNRTGAIVWVEQTQTLYPHGLTAFGLDPNDIILVQTYRERDTLSVLEDALRTDGIAAVVGHIEKAGLDETRRLQLAVKRSGNIGLLLRVMRTTNADITSACATRWRLRHAPSEDADGLPGLGQTRWRASLDKVRHRQPQEWLVDWQDGGFQLVRPPLPLQAMQPAREQMRRWR